MRVKIILIPLLVCGLLCSSCDKYFGIDTNDFQEEDNTYKDRSTIYAGLLGLSASFRTVAEHHIILSELMGDLMTPTVTAPDEYWDLFRYKYEKLDKGGNSFASPAPYYKLIVNCNDYLKHLIEYNRQFPDALAKDVYKGIIATALTYRTWAYLQIGKIYGEAVYFDIAYSDKDSGQPQRLLQFDDLIQELLYNVKVGVDGVDAYQKLNWRTIVNPEGEDSKFDQLWNRMGISPEVLVCELHLWAKDYTNAAKTGISFLTSAGTSYKLASDKGMAFLFQTATPSEMSDEAMTAVWYDHLEQQTHNLQRYFWNTGSGLYYFSPTLSARVRFMSQITDASKDKVTGELKISRGTDSRANISITTNNGESVISKYNWKLSTTYNDNDAPIYIYRASELWLMIAEALNALGNTPAADSLLNVGMIPSWNAQNSYFEIPFESPIYAASLNSCRGIRGRAKMKGDYVKYHVDTTRIYTDEQLVERKKFILDSLLLEETALELAYEGKRWFTMMRIARNSERPEHLAIPVSQKFGDEAEIYKRWLMKPENWFIKWDMKQIVNEAGN